MRKVSLLMVLSIILSIFAVNNTVLAQYVPNSQKAYALKELGLFMGSENGFELDRQPNRLEGAVMLVRLLGKEKSALASNSKCPFNDVPAWAAPYVGYMYSNRLTSGKSQYEFGSEDLITPEQYLTFVLRALGYDDSKGDFSWDEARDKALNVDLIDGATYSTLKQKSFLRDDVVGISYDALEVNLKGQDKSLSDKLVEEKVITAEQIEKAQTIISTPVDEEEEDTTIGDNTTGIPSKPHTTSNKPNWAYEGQDLSLICYSEYWDTSNLNILDGGNRITSVLKPSATSWDINKAMVYNNEIYYIAYNKKWVPELFRTDLKAQGVPVKVLEGSTIDFAIENDRIYALNEERNKVTVVDLSGKQISSQTFQTEILNFNVLNGNLIYVTYVDAHKLGKIRNMGELFVRQNGTDTKIAEAPVNNLQLVGDKVYYTAGEVQNLYSISADGTDKKLVMENVGDFCVYGDNIYYENLSDSVAIESSNASVTIGKLYSASIDGTGAARIVDGHAQSISVVNGWVYFTEYFDSGAMNGEIKKRVSVAGGEAEQLQ